jgi:hypothetical protein
MIPSNHLRSSLAVFLCLAFSGLALNAQDKSPSEETPAMHHATGSFAVELKPMDPPAEHGGSNFSRMSLDKKFSGDLEGTSQGQMLAVRTANPQSAGYVAMEFVEGTLGGRAGSFVLQHSSTMDQGAPHQSITVVPDSGTGELEGLSGSMIIDITEEGHLYRFDYSLPSADG